MSEQIEPGEGWRLLGQDELVSGLGDEYKRADNTWIKVPSYPNGEKASQFIAVRRRIPAKPEAMEIHGHTVSLDNNSVRIESLFSHYFFSGRTQAIRQLGEWLISVADWQEAQEAGK